MSGSVSGWSAFLLGPASKNGAHPFTGRKTPPLTVCPYPRRLALQEDSVLLLPRWKAWWLVHAQGCAPLCTSVALETGETSFKIQPFCLHSRKDYPHSSLLLPAVSHTFFPNLAHIPASLKKSVANQQFRSEALLENNGLLFNRGSSRGHFSHFMITEENLSPAAYQDQLSPLGIPESPGCRSWWFLPRLRLRGFVSLDR